MIVRQKGYRARFEMGDDAAATQMSGRSGNEAGIPTHRDQGAELMLLSSPKTILVESGTDAFSADN
ncbi:MAG: hypothetical protein Fur0025_41450 [Oscillatoriaceae cyanobacterium]